MNGETTLITSMDQDQDLAVRGLGPALVCRAEQLACGGRSSLMTYGRR